MHPDDERELVRMREKLDSIRGPGVQNTPNAIVIRTPQVRRRLATAPRQTANGGIIYNDTGSIVQTVTCSSTTYQILAASVSLPTLTVGDSYDIYFGETITNTAPTAVPQNSPAVISLFLDGNLLTTTNAPYTADAASKVGLLHVNITVISAAGGTMHYSTFGSIISNRRNTLNSETNSYEQYLPIITANRSINYTAGVLTIGVKNDFSGSPIGTFTLTGAALQIRQI